MQAILEARLARRARDLLEKPDGSDNAFAESETLSYWRDVLEFGEQMALDMRTERRTKQRELEDDLGYSVDED